MVDYELPRGKPRGITERNPQELRSELRGILIPQMRDKSVQPFIILPVAQDDVFAVVVPEPHAVRFTPRIVKGARAQC